MDTVRQKTTRYYIPPIKVNLEGYTYNGKYASYSDYNYLQPGIASFMRTRHFEQALKLTREYFHKANVIDFGCADGPFLPSLSKYFNHVFAIDNSPIFLKIASKVVNIMNLSNVELLCNDDIMLDVVASKIAGHKYQILFLLETLEHIGNKAAPWESRIDFIKELFSLLDEKAIIIISVPNMIGISFLLQRLGFLLLNVKNKEKVSLTDLLKVTLFNETTNLEKQWQGGHLGFNHKKLEYHLENDFTILNKKNIIFQVLYKLSKSYKPEAFDNNFTSTLCENMNEPRYNNV